MYNVNLTTEDKDFAKDIMDCVIESVDKCEPKGYTSYSMSNTQEECECECCECDCHCIEEEHKLKGLGFGIAFDFLTENPEFGMRLPYWKEDWVVRIYCEEDGFMTHPCLCLETEDDNIPFVVDYMSLFSEEWEIVE